MISADRHKKPAQRYRKRAAHKRLKTVDGLRYAVCVGNPLPDYMRTVESWEDTECKRCLNIHAAYLKDKPT